MGKVVERKKLKWYQELYLPQVLQGLGMTFRQMFKKHLKVIEKNHLKMK